MQASAHAPEGNDEENDDKGWQQDHGKKKGARP
jgi:hypothetical protein